MILNGGAGMIILSAEVQEGRDRMDKKFNPIKWARDIIPRSQSQLEVLIMKLLKIAFWVALLAPVVLVPVYYLVLALIR
jgi:hypothetical protein